MLSCTYKEIKSKKSLVLHPVSQTGTEQKDEAYASRCHLNWPLVAAHLRDTDNDMQEAHICLIDILSMDNG